MCFAGQLWDFGLFCFRSMHSNKHCVKNNPNGWVNIGQNTMG